MQHKLRLGQSHAAVMEDTTKEKMSSFQSPAICLGDHPKRRHHHLLFSQTAQPSTIPQQG